mmetsp:Transcript_21975/g.36368  ORF Transcript_21975/g.36368 Transcript_21975/m.36368 type:complete len:1054 (-) Transcript_21975:893-4054(-)
MGSCQSTEEVGATEATKPRKAEIATTEKKKVVQNVERAMKPVETKPEVAAISETTAETHFIELATVPLSDSANSKDYSPGYASGGSTPMDGRSLDGRSLDGSDHGRDRANSVGNPKNPIIHSSSVLGLDSMIEIRKEEGVFSSNVVHIEVPFGKPIEEVYDGVHHGPVLGSGISGLVRLVSHKATGVKYAVKCLDLGLVNSPEGLMQLREEIFIMCQLDHPNIVRLEEVYESHNEIYLVQELCLGGELFDRLDEQPDYHYTEAECARLVKQMLCAVRYLHSKGIIHRDLKLENFLFSSSSADSELKMIDFGLSKHFKFGEVHNEAVGTPYTVAPEVIRGQYDERCDCWAIGVITYLLLSGDPPFGGCGGPEPLLTVRSNILKGSFHFEPQEIWSIVSPQARTFISSLLVTDPKHRPTARESQKHQWLREWATRTRKEDDNILNPNVVKALVSFKEFSDMRKLLCEVLSFTLLPDQIKDLRKEFEKMDTDGSGEISLEALKQVLMTNAGAGSLGALTETEVEDIFNAMRVRKTETRIHWHEFIAAGLSQCQVDDRNLRLAFDRLDSDHKGYITFDNVMDLMGNDAIQSEDAMRRMWGDSMKACNSNHARITYDDFLLLMKGQTRESTEVVIEMPIQGMLGVVHEAKISEEGGIVEGVPDGVLVLPSGEQIGVSESVAAGGPGSQLRRGSWGAGTSSSLGTPPITPLLYNPVTVAQMPELDLPLSMDDDEVPRISSLVRPQSIMRSTPPPQSPAKGSPEYVTPLSERKGVPTIPNMAALGLLPSLSKPLPYIRRRSRSVDDQDPDMDEHEVPSFGADARRAMMFAENDHSKEGIDSIIKDETKTPLVVNRQLYRAHRQMRLAVLDATKRFEEQQAIRAREILMAQRDDEGGSEELGPVGAGLVLRHGLRRQVSSEAVGTWLKKTMEEQAVLVQKANRRGGRGRSRRQKTISDMTGMLAGLSSDLNQATAEIHGGLSPEIQGSQSQPFAVVTDPRLSDVALSAVALSTARSESESALDIPLDVDLEDFPPLRNATVPGVFRTTNDPFAAGGRYGLL